MTINKASVAWLCFMWAVLLLIGIAVGLNLPFILAVVGTVLLNELLREAAQEGIIPAVIVHNDEEFLKMAGSQVVEVSIALGKTPVTNT
jgi:EamA domain-containing membrane protein RarD